MHPEQLNMQLCEAIIDKNIEAIKKAVSDGADINAHFHNPLGGILHMPSFYKENETHLHFVAAQRQYKTIAELLIKLGANVNALNDDKETPLHIATESNNADIVKLLLENGADVNAKNDHEATPLYYAKTSDVAKLLISHGADLNARYKTDFVPNESWKEDEPTLHHALLKHYYGVAKLLIENGADVNAEDVCICTPLHYAKTVEIAKLLLQHGADVNAKNEEEETPLFNVETPEMAELLLQHGADVNAQRFGEDESVLYAVIDRNHDLKDKDIAAIVEVLLKHGADVNLGQPGWETPLHVASMSGRIECAKVLIKYGANVNAKREEDEDKATPLDVACDDKMEKLLIANGAKSAKDN